VPVDPPFWARKFDSLLITAAITGAVISVQLKTASSYAKSLEFWPQTLRLPFVRNNYEESLQKGRVLNY